MITAYAVLRDGRTVTFRPVGTSMTPRIQSRQEVTVRPCNGDALKVGDVAFARVAGVLRLHLVTAVDPVKRRVQISNNHGHVNGWTGFDKVYGKADV